MEIERNFKLKQLKIGKNIAKINRSFSWEKTKSKAIKSKLNQENH